MLKQAPVSIIFSPTRPHWAELVYESPCPCVCVSVCVSVCAIVCSFFLGLSLALRSHDQIPASHWATPPFKKKIDKITQPIKKNDKSHNLFKFVSVLLSALVERVGVSRMRDFLEEIRRLHYSGFSQISSYKADS